MTNQQANDMVVVAKFEQGVLIACKEFDSSAYFSARQHAMFLADREIYDEAEMQVRDQVTQEVLFTCTRSDIKAKTKKLKPYYPPEEA